MIDHDTDSYEKISRALSTGGPRGISPETDPRQHHAAPYLREGTALVGLTLNYLLAPTDAEGMA
jgi:hypothetical protein